MILSGDTDAVVSLLSKESQLYENIAYLIVTDTKGNLLGQAFNEKFIKEPFDIQAKKNDVIEIVSPILYKSKDIGTIKSGVSILSENAFIRQVMTSCLIVLAAIIVITFLIARFFLRYTTNPIVTLTRIADEIALGNLDMDIFFGRHVDCWEIKKCTQKDCAAYKNTSVKCWFIDDTPCEGYEPKFPQKLEGCRKCEVYKTHKGDEIVQLADSFQHMVYMRKASRDELEKSDKYQSNLIQSSLIGIIATDEYGIVKIFNHVAENITGYYGSEVIEKLTLKDLFGKSITSKIDQLIMFDDYGRKLYGFKPEESNILNRNKEPIPVRLSAINLYEDEDKEHIGRVFFFQDLREIKALRQELIQSERLAATGQTVARISHSIKNILDGLMGGAYVYRRGNKIKDKKAIQKGWEMIEKNIDLISELVISLLNFAKDREPVIQKCDPRDIVKDVIETMENKASYKKIKMVVEYKGDFHNIYLDSSALYQCLMNLVSNSIDAIPPEPPGQIIIKVESKNERGITFEVSDNGVGMNNEIKNKLFQEMYSSKGSKGTGLGLLVVKKIVSEHGGNIDVHTEENIGSTFKIWLPQNNSNITTPGDI
jgi:PAS domain S-box-containing protein